MANAFNSAHTYRLLIFNEPKLFLQFAAVISEALNYDTVFSAFFTTSKNIF
jgi:hypothetical protein